jgi:ubiquinone biosynthesis protein COQ9
MGRMSDINALTSAELRPLLIAALPAHVAFDGWSESALASGAADIGLTPGRERLIFPDRAPGVLVEAWLDQINRQMTEQLAGRLDNLKIRDRITQALTTRLTILAPDKEAVRRALTVLSWPGNAPRTARSAWAAADAMWRAAGDTATDWNHYSKRTILAGVYSATLMVWINDDTPDFATTRAFIDRRIAGIMRFETAKRQWQQRRAQLPSITRFLGRLRYPPAA